MATQSGISAAKARTRKHNTTINIPQNDHTRNAHIQSKSPSSSSSSLASQNRNQTHHHLFSRTPPQNKLNSIVEVHNLLNKCTNDNTDEDDDPERGSKASDDSDDENGDNSPGNTGTSNTKQNLRIVVLGAKRVGKTHLVQQLVNCSDKSAPAAFIYKQLSSSSSSSRSKSRCKWKKKKLLLPTFYYPIILFNEHVYNVSLIDCPYIECFPTDSLQDWSILGGCNIRDVSGFILVFDVASEASFQYIKSMRDQILELGIEAPIVVAANKSDLFANIASGRLVSSQRSTQSGGIANSGSGAAMSAVAVNTKRELSAIVKKHWKGTVLVECSSKYNWRVLTVLKELMRMIDNRDNHPKKTAARAMHNAFKRNQCHIM